MTLRSVGADTPNFDPIIYIRMLVAIAKADKDNGPPEYAFVRRQALRWGVDYDHLLNTTDKDFIVERQIISRTTALTILRDAIVLASLDHNFSLPERQRIYGYAEKFDIARNEVDALESIVKAFRQLNDRWHQLVNSR